MNDMASVKVAVRVRPFNQRERDMGAKLVIQMEGKKTRILNAKAEERGRDDYKDFTFDHSYWSFDSADPHFASQEDVFGDLGTDVVDSAFQGYNACVFAYGQTGSGKTFTMMGAAGCQGLIPRICQALFGRMQTGKEQGASYRTEVSYLEIYNEKVKDLLGRGSAGGGPRAHSLRVREHPRLGPYVQDLSRHLVTDYQDIAELMEQGNDQRTTASTNMNDVSSRSHAIFTITFVQAGFSNDLPTETVSKIHLVDLAGSERADTSGATGQRLMEGAHINKSLVTLGSVISALAELSSATRGQRLVFIPYRDSVLTWLLKDSLGGNAKTIMIAAVSPADCNYSETMSTLRYANRAKNIINKPTVNEDQNVKLIRELREEINKLRAMINNEHREGVCQPQVLAQLHQKEAQEKVLTEEWAEKWRETQKILQEQKALALRKSGQGVVLDSDMPHLVSIDDDLLSTGITLYHLKEGDTLIGTDEASTKQDIVLNRAGMEPEHCIITLQEGVATLVPLRDAQCWVNTVLIEKPTRLSQGCIILLGRCSMFRYNDPAEAAQLRKGGSHSQLNLSRLSLLSWSTTDLAWSTENLLKAAEDADRLDDLAQMRVSLRKEQEAFKREQAEKEEGWEKEQQMRMEALETAQRELEKEKRQMEQQFAAQCSRLAEDWKLLEKHQQDSLAVLHAREEELRQRQESLLWERNEEMAQISSEHMRLAALKNRLEIKKRNFIQFMSGKLRQMKLQRRRSRDYTQTLASGDDWNNCDSSPDTWASPATETDVAGLQAVKELARSHREEMAELESELQERVDSVSLHRQNVNKLDQELEDIHSFLQADAAKLEAMRKTLSSRTQEQLQKIAERKQSLSLDLRAAVPSDDPSTGDASSELPEGQELTTVTLSSTPGTGDTFHTATSPGAPAAGEASHTAASPDDPLGDGDLVTGDTSAYDGAPVAADASPVVAAPVAADASPVVAAPVAADASPVVAAPVAADASPVAGSSDGPVEVPSPAYTPMQYVPRVRRPPAAIIRKYPLIRTDSLPENVKCVGDAMRAMKQLFQRIADQKMLIMHSLENDCDKTIVNAQIALLQDLQKQYVRLERALEHHPLKLSEVDGNESSEDSDDVSTSVDDGASDILPKLDHKFSQHSFDPDRRYIEMAAALSPFSPLTPAESCVDSESAIFCNVSLSSPQRDKSGIWIHIPSYVLRGTGSSTHYEYEVHVSVGGDRWTLMRRYKRFRELHLSMVDKYGRLVVQEMQWS
ncbi:kinesin-like protein Klp98A isoform X2 [Bacillus rossius redtenbacheri]|uniref:kinesin-like protein Klp98A isoform X2 n=1 Tax=Bacillus rossius redtenbacheri TaxID=93214 RepID=UPI002FDE1887